MDIDKLKAYRPDLVGMDDETVLRAIAQDYPGVPQEQIARDLQLNIAPPPAPGRTLGGTIKDFGISALKGAIAVPEAAVGLADFPTAGAAGKAVEGLGVRFKDAKGFLDENYSDAQKAANAKVQNAEGFMDTLGAAVTNPSTIAHSVVESVPSMLAGGVIARGGIALTMLGPATRAAIAALPEAERAVAIAEAVRKVSPAMAAVGEGVTQAGSAAEQIRQETGTFDKGQQAMAVTSGALDTALALVGAKVAKALKIADPDVMIAAGKANDAASKNIVRRVLEGMVAEGVLEELPQSIQEQVHMNMATGKPLTEGVDNAAVMGLLSGAVMGGGANALHGGKKPETKPGVDATSTPPSGAPIPLDPEAGPLERAAAAVDPTVTARVDTESTIQDAVRAAIEDKGTPYPQPEKQDAKADRDEAIYNDVHELDGAPTTDELFPLPTTDVDKQAHEAATSPHNDLPEPTDAQKEAGNYKKGHINVAGLNISIENPQGSERRGKRPDGTEWAHTMSNHYGYVKRTIGADEEQVDVYVGPRHDAPSVFVIDQVNQHDNSFDEHKAMIGFASRAGAVNAYKANFDKGWTMGRMTEMPVDEFKKWLNEGDLKKPASPKGPLVPALGGMEPPRDAMNAQQWADLPGRKPNASAPAKAAPDANSGALPAANGAVVPPVDAAAPIGRTGPGVAASPGGDANAAGPAVGADASNQSQAGVRATGKPADAETTPGDRIAALGKKLADENKPFIAAMNADIEKNRGYKVSDDVGAALRKLGVEPVATHKETDWELKVPKGNLSDVVVSFDPETHRATVKAMYMGQVKDTRVADGAAAIAEAVEHAIDGFNQAVARMAREHAAKTRGLPERGELHDARRLPYPGRPKGVPLADITVHKMGDGYAAGRGFMVEQGGYGSNESHHEKFATPEEAVHEAADDLRTRVKSAMEKPEANGGMNATDRKRADSILKWLDKQDPPPKPEKPKPAMQAEPAVDLLDEKAQAAKAKMLEAAGELAHLLTKSARLNITPEQEQKMLPIVIKLFEGAMELGYVTFKQAARYVRNYIAKVIDQEAADAIPMDTLQGAYIATARRHVDKAVTPKGEVIAIDTIEQLNEDESAAVAPPSAAPAQPGSLMSHFTKEIDAGNMPKDNVALKKMVEAFDGKTPDAARMKVAQEFLEAAIVVQARKIAAANKDDRAAFDAMLKLYESQPLLNIRTSISVENQAYSTPAPLALLASRLADIDGKTKVYEPTAGTGMLLMEANPKKSEVNELNDDRADLLRAQGFKVTQNDATDAPQIDPVDVVIANPPFGPLDAKTSIDGYTMGQIDHVIAARALASMVDGGKATLILGASKVQGGVSSQDRTFFNWLYSHYDVTAHFEVDGKLYTRQGAGWPVRVIRIEGRINKPDAIGPLEGVIQRAATWEQVYEQYENALAAERRPVGDAASGAGSPGIVKPETRPVSKPAGATPAVPDERKSASGNGGTATVAGAGAGTVVDSGGSAGRPVGDGAVAKPGDAKPAGENRLDEAGQRADARRSAGPRDDGGNAGVEGNQFQARYVPRSSRKDDDILIPVNMAQPLQDALNRLEDAVGDIDEFTQKELGYKSVDDMHEALMGLQVDSVASSIHQIKQGKATIIADQTGIGKGRQAAAIIRWAVKHGHTPIFMSVKPSLFTDMFGDLADIGTNDVAPFIMNVGETIKAPTTGERLFETKPAERGRAIRTMEGGALPEGRNALFLTYSQINSERAQRGALTGLAPNAVFILDESHNASGESNTGDFIKGVLDAAKGVVYLSATYAKRPDNMPVYFKTDIGEAVADDDTLMQAMASGGLPLQTVVANNLVKAGQMFRRERSYDGVNIRTVVDVDNRALHEEMSDRTTLALRSIVSADRTFHSIFVKQLQKEMAASGGTVRDIAGNQVQRTVDHTQFTSVVHNFVRQMLLGLNAQTAADNAIQAIKDGKKALIALENTMGSFLSEYSQAHGIKVGDELGEFDYRTVLTRALDRTRYVVEVDRTGQKVKRYIPLSMLDGETLQAYQKAQRIIDGLDLDIPVSPIDWMRQQIVNAGYTVAEVTGRDLVVDYSDPDKPKLAAIDKAEQTDKVGTTDRFNGKMEPPLDSLILNVAGSTGISLHASEKFPDQSKRKMIVAQAAQDINIFMQMLGRIHRTGQVELPEYDIQNVDLPAVRRPTALLSGKMKSLNANTSSNTESATSVQALDMLNKYGDQVVAQYLGDNWRLSMEMGIESPLNEKGEASEEDLARKATGRLALMPVAVQKQFYEEVETQYAALIDYLNKTNQNELEPRTFDFDAKELKTAVLFKGENPESPFGQDAIYGEYSIKNQGKAMTPEEIGAEIKEHLAGKSGSQHAHDLIVGLGDGFRAYVNTLETDEQVNAANETYARTMEFMESHAIGSMFRVDINGDQFNAVVTNLRSTHKKGGNPYAMSKVQVTIAVNGALRHLTVPGTQFKNIEVSTLQAYGLHSLFSVQEEARSRAKIVTGNLLGAYGQITGAKGTIISFTKSDGTVEQGILLPKLFNMADNTRGDFRLPDGAAAVKFLASGAKNLAQLGVSTRDNIVRVLPSPDGVKIMVPKSKAGGGKYFLDRNLIALTGDFVTVGGKMVAIVAPNKAAAALDYLMKKQALYVLPSMANDARKALGLPPEASTNFRQGDSTPGMGTPQHVGRLQAFADALSEKWAASPDIVVVSGIASPALPAAVRAEARDLIMRGGRVPSGAVHDGIVYLFADRIPNERAAATVILHEVKGHMGMRGHFGKDFDRVLAELAQARPADIAAMIEKNGFKPEERMRAAEEVLAEMAEKDPTIGFVRRAVAAIKTWLRQNMPTVFGDMALTDDEIIRNILMPAARFIETGARNQGAGTAFSQAGRQVQVDGQWRSIENSKGQLIAKEFDSQQAFWKWFGESKAVDEEGNPLVLYHGTPKGDIGEQFVAGLNEEGGIYFTDKPIVAGGYTYARSPWLSVGDAAIYPAYLSLKNPLVIDAMGRRHDNIPVPWAEWKPKVYGNLPKGAVNVRQAMAWARENGYDGLIVRNVVDTVTMTDRTKSTVYAVFDSAQIKSTTGNRGTFDDGRNIMFSQSAGVNDARDFWDEAKGMLQEVTNSPGKLNWWQKTFGTPYDLAQRHPDYKAVFDRVQEFLRDVSAYATEAADRAPSILPKLDSYRDILPQWAGGSGKKPLSPEDAKAVQAPINQGTLDYTRGADGKPVLMDDVRAAADKMSADDKARQMFKEGHLTESVWKMWQGQDIDTYEKMVNTRYDSEVLRPGLVWTDAELKSMFNLSEQQIGIYKQFRSAVDKSLNDLGMADLLRFVGKDIADMRRDLLEQGDFQKAAERVRDRLLEMSNSLEAMDPTRSKALAHTAGVVMDKANHIEAMQEAGYAPLSRFGKYVVDVLGKDGERLYFGLYEGRMDARAAAEKLAKMFPGAAIIRGTTSQEEYKLYASMSPETAELFGELLGLESDGGGAANVAFQQFIKQAKSNNSAMKRLVGRKGIAGFSEDVGRVLAAFIYSNSRLTSQNLHTKEIAERVGKVGLDANGHKVNGELKDAAVKLMTYVRDPQEEATGLRGVLFAQYLGGSAAAMLVNMTQPFMVTMPYLSQWAGIGGSAKHLARATSEVWKKTHDDPKLDAALKLAEERGIVAPQEIHQLMAQSRGKGGLRSGDGTLFGNASATANNQLAKLVVAWGRPFAIAELFNRRITFIAAYRVAVDRGIADPSAFAEEAVNQTQFIYNKGNKPQWARGAVGSVLFTFKQYSISYLELLTRMYTQGGPEGKKAALFMLAMLMLMGGAGGLPFEEDVLDLVDGAAQRMGYNLRAKHARQKFLEDHLGAGLGRFVDKGVTGLPGMPIDVSARFGMANLIPGTGLLTKKTDHTQDVVEFAGPAGDFGTRLFQGANKLAEGDVKGAGLAVAPRAATNAAKAIDMAQLGYYTDMKGKKVIDTDAYDVAAKLIGFQPSSVSRVQEANRDAQQMVALVRLREAEIADKWAMAVFKNDPEAAKSARDELHDWNVNNPDSPIKIKYNQITKRVREMHKPKDQRIAESAPKEVRAAVKRELQESKQ